MSNIIKSSYVIIQNPTDVDNTKKIVKPIANINSNSYVANGAYETKEKIITDAANEAKEIINSANEYKKSVMEKASREIEEQAKLGYEAGSSDGYNDGYAVGLENGAKQGRIQAEEEVNNKYEGLIADLCNQICKVEEAKDDVLKRFEKGLVKLSIDIAERIIRSRVNEDDDIIKAIITNSIKDYRNVEWVKIYLSGDDYVTVSTDKEIMDRISQISENVKLEVMLDAINGDLIIETPENLIDSGINTQLNNVRNMILGT